MAEDSPSVASGSRQKTVKRKKEQEKAYADYKLLLQEIDSFTEAERTEEANEFISTHLAKTAKLYPKIHKRYDLAPIDAEHFKKLAALGAEATSKFKIGSALLDLVVFGNKLRRALRHGDSSVDLSHARCALGKDIDDCLLAPPVFEFLYGAMNPEGFEFKPRAVRKVEKREKIEPKVFVKAAEKNSATETNEDATPKEVDLIYKRLKVTAKQNNMEQINMLENILDKKSFGQSVENLFHFSFLVKENKVAIKESSEGKPTCKFVKQAATQSETLDKSQSILSFSMVDYRKWIQDIEGNENNENS